MTNQKLWSVLVLAVMPVSAFGIVTANYTENTNLRFNDHLDFIGSAYDFSGVGRSDNGRWATLLGENYFISANHFKPNAGTTITFVNGNSVSDDTFSYTVAGGFQVSGTDFWIGYTAEAMDSSLARYSYSTKAANSLADTELAGVDLLISGDLVVNPSQGRVTDHVVGTNQGESFRAAGTTAMSTPQHTVNFDTAAPFDQLVTFENLSGDNTNNFTTYESQLENGDSGSPLFSIIGGNLILQGTAWAVALDIPGNFIDTPGALGSPNDPLEARNATFYTYIGSYETELLAAIANVPAPIPEPGVTIFMAVGGLVLLRRRR